MNDNPSKSWWSSREKTRMCRRSTAVSRVCRPLSAAISRPFPSWTSPARPPAEIVCNEEGKLLGLTPNRLLKDSRGVPYDVVCGTFFVAGVNDGDFASLTDAQIALYKSKYSREKLYELPDGRYASRPPKKKGERSHER